MPCRILIPRQSHRRPTSRQTRSSLLTTGLTSNPSAIPRPNPTYIYSHVYTRSRTVCLCLYIITIQVSDTPPSILSITDPMAPTRWHHPMAPPDGTTRWHPPTLCGGFGRAVQLFAGGFLAWRGLVVVGGGWEWVWCCQVRFGDRAATARARLVARQV